MGISVSVIINQKTPIVLVLILGKGIYAIVDYILKMNKFIFTINVFNLTTEVTVLGTSYSNAYNTLITKLPNIQVKHYTLEPYE